MVFMKLDVPFYRQTGIVNCGTTVLRMVLNYLGGNFDLDIIELKARIKDGKGIFTTQLSVAARELGYGAELHSIDETFNEDNMKEDFYKKFADSEFSKGITGWNNRAKKLGVNFSDKSFKIDEIISRLSKWSVPIVLIDWNIIKGKAGYKGHFVPLVGFDKENVFIHNSGDDNGAFVKIPKKLFDEARNANGTDEDILIITKL